MTIRLLSVADLDLFYPLFKKLVLEDFPEYQPDAARIYVQLDNKKYYEELYKKNKGVVIGAYSGHDIIAFLVVSTDDGGVGSFKWLAVEKSHRKQGIATALLKAGEEWLLEHKCHYMYLHTENLKNVEFYKKRGYEYLGLRKNSWFGVDEHLMQKQLHEKPFPEIFNP